MLSIVAFILLAIGGLAAAVGAIWFIIVAFKEGPLWGIGVIVIPFVSLIFLIKFWSDAWKPFVLQTLGGFVVGIGAAIFIPTMANDMAASATAFEDSYSEDDYGDGYDEYAEDDYGDDSYAEDDYAEDDSYSDDAYGEDGTAVAEGDVEAEDGVSAGDPAGQDPQIADSGLDPTLPAAATPSAPRRPTTPPARLGGSFARSTDDNSIPMERVSDHIGKRIKIIKNSGNIVYCRLLEVNEDNLVIHQSLGGGMVRFTLPKDSIQRIAKDTRR